MYFLELYKDPIYHAYVIEIWVPFLDFYFSFDFDLSLQVKSDGSVGHMPVDINRPALTNRGIYLMAFWALLENLEW